MQYKKNGNYTPKFEKMENRKALGKLESAFIADVSERREELRQQQKALMHGLLDKINACVDKAEFSEAVRQECSDVLLNEARMKFRGSDEVMTAISVVKTLKERSAWETGTKLWKITWRNSIFPAWTHWS